MWQALRRAIGRLVRPGRPPKRRNVKNRPYKALAASAPEGARPREDADGGRPYKEYSVPLPDGYPARAIRVRLSIPPLPARRHFTFSDHATDESGRPAQRVLAASDDGGFAISEDLGRTWREVRLAPYRRRRVLHVRDLGGGEYLVQAEALKPPRELPMAVDVLVVNDTGEILAASPALSVHWHGCRAVDMRDGVLMYAEYPPNPGRRGPYLSRVFRSRDRGRSWQVVFELTGNDIRHFHYLQARPGAAGEWWLTSGDAPDASRIWITRNDGDDWHEASGDPMRKLAIGGSRYPHDLYRLTDIAFLGDEVVWGTDDLMWDVKGEPPGARLFRSPIAATLAPLPVFRCKWHIRNLVDVGEFLLVLSQGCPLPQEVGQDAARPSVYLMPKRAIAGAPEAVHLFDVDTYSAERTGFSAARASRAAVDGTFFSRRAENDVFRGGHQVLRWDVAFE